MSQIKCNIELENELYRNLNCANFDNASLCSALDAVIDLSTVRSNARLSEQLRPTGYH